MNCPTCGRKIPDDGEGDDTCRRCETELAALRQLADDADAAVRQGQASLKDQCPAEAGRCFRTALGIDAQAPKARQGLALASLLVGDYRAALDAWSRCSRSAEPQRGFTRR